MSAQQQHRFSHIHHLNSLTFKFSLTVFPWWKRSKSTVKMLVVAENFDQSLTPAADVWFSALKTLAAVHTWTLSVAFSVEDSHTIFQALDPQTPAVVTRSEHIQGVCVIHNLKTQANKTIETNL